jgi:hypothetical protein
MKLLKIKLFWVATLIGIVLLVALYKVPQVFINTPGPKRDVVYFPKDSVNAGFWLLIDSVPKIKKQVTINYHAIGTVTKQYLKGLDNRYPIIQQGNDYFLLLPLTDTNIEYDSSINFNTNRVEPWIKFNSKQNRVVSLLMPVELHKLPIICRQEKLIQIQTDSRMVRILLNANDGRNIDDGHGIQTDADYCIIEFVHSDSLSNSERLNCCFLSNATWADYKDLHLMDSKKRETGIWEEGKWTKTVKNNKSMIMKGASEHSPIPITVSVEVKHAKGIDTVKNIKRHAELFFSESDIQELSRDGSFSDMLNTYRNVAKQQLNKKRMNDNWSTACAITYTALIARIDNDSTLLQCVKKQLMQINEIYNYNQLLDRADIVWWYTYAFGIILPLLNENDIEAIRCQLAIHSEPLYKHYNNLPENAWRNVIGSSLGLAGVILNKKEWVNLIIRHLDKYLSNSIKEGICYEGNSYLSYGFRNMPFFLYCLARTDEYNVNFFDDFRYQQLIASLIAQAGPNNEFPCFEDCSHKSEVSEIIYSSGYIFNFLDKKKGLARFENLAKMCKWVEKTTGSKYYYKWLPDSPIYLNGTSELIKPSLQLLKPWLQSDNNLTESYVFSLGGITVLRSGWEQNDDVFVLSAKPYKQSHIHFDELSFELWESGKNWFSNPGYPGYGAKNHNWTTQTQASNTIEIDGIGQVNESGAFIEKYSLGKRVQYVCANGVDLYKHPVNYFTFIMYFIGIIAVLFLGISLYLISVEARYKENVFSLKFTNNTNVNKLPVSTLLFNCSGNVFTLSKIELICERIIYLINDKEMRRGIKKFNNVIQCSVFGIFCFMVSFFLLNALGPFLEFYSSEIVYSNLQVFKRYVYFYPVICFFAGFFLMYINLLLLDSLVFKFTSSTDLTTNIFKDILRICYADITPIVVMILIGFFTLSHKFSTIFNAFVVENFDPISIQKNIGFWGANAIVLTMIVYFIKMVFQFMAIKKCSSILGHITNTAEWKNRGFRLALSAILLKKAIVLTILLIIVLVVFMSATLINTETLKIL